MAASSTDSSSSSESESSTHARTRTQKRKRPVPEPASSSASDTDTEPEDAPAESDNDADDAPEEDVPVLSHKELRRQKKKQLKAAAAAQPADEAADGAPAAKKQKVKNTAELAPSKVPKRQNSVWVGNLSFKTTPDALRKFFDGVGEITRVHMPMKMASAGPGARGAVKENRGFAYVDFATEDAKTLAITLSENNLDGRRLLIKDGGDFTGRPSTSTKTEDGENADAKPSLTGHTKTAQKILKVQKQPAGPTLFFGNLGFETTEDSIRDLLTRHRAKQVKAEDEAEDMEKEKETEKEAPKKDAWIRKIRMGTFEDSGKCKGWAFVDFTSTEHATAALTNPKNHFLDGRKLVVEYASPEAVRRGGGGPRPKKPEGGAHAEHAGPRRERVRPKRKHDGDAGADASAPAERTEEAPSPAKRRKMEDAEREAPPHKERRERREREGKSKVRAKPGAALANAKRETVGIVPSIGKKIVF